MLELALVLVPVAMLLFGVIVFGYLLSFKQNMTQAAGEGARAGAVETPDNAPTAALNATNQALSAFGQSCSNGAMTCSASVATCPNSSGQCLTVTVTYDYSHHPLMPDVPLVSAAIPASFTASNTARVTS